MEGLGREGIYVGRALGLGGGECGVLRVGDDFLYLHVYMITRVFMSR